MSSSFWLLIPFWFLYLLILLTRIPFPPFFWHTTLPEYLVQWGNEGVVAGILPYSRCRRECFQQTPCSFMFLYWNIILALQCFPNTGIYHLWIMRALFIGLKKFKIHFTGLKKFPFIPSLLRVSIINEYSIRVIIHKILKFSISSCVCLCKLHFSRNLYVFWSFQVIIKLSTIFSFLKNCCICTYSLHFSPRGVICIFFVFQLINLSRSLSVSLSCSEKYLF